MDNKIEYKNTEGKLPLYFCQPRCYTCGRNISSIWVKYKRALKNLTGNEYTNLPIRTIDNTVLLSNDPKTEEGKVLDKYGITSYCCRRMLLSQPMNKV